MSAVPLPPPPLSPLSVAGLRDILGYPLRGGALALLVALLLSRAAVSLLPALFVPLCQWLLWLPLYKYALEVMGTSGLGKAEPPEVLTRVDDSVHRRHLLLQVLVLLTLALVMWLLPEWSAVTVIGAGLVLPGLILSLAVAHNLPAAVNPLNWLVVAATLGIGYGALALGWMGLIVLQVDGRNWLSALPDWLVGPAFYLLTHYAVLVLFRWMGLHLHANAARLGYDLHLEATPELARDREALAISRGAWAAREIADPAQRAAQLRELLRRGGDDALHRDYRAALRAAGLRDELLAHAAVRTSELVAMGRLREATMLAREGLEDAPTFTLPDAEPLATLLDQMERLAQWRSMAALARNYFDAYPKRDDALRMGLRAAAVLADQLDERAEAVALLDAAIVRGEALGDSEPARALRNRLETGLRLRDALPG